MTKTPLERLGFKPQAPKVPASQMTPLQRLGVVNAFKEGDHKRDDSGKFSSGGDSGKKSDAKKSKDTSKPKDPKKKSKTDSDKEKDVKDEAAKNDEIEKPESTDRKGGKVPTYYSKTLGKKVTVPGSSEIPTYYSKNLGKKVTIPE
jgi:hypothetical protein